eukprot:TRINITY_DN49512_c0_g1_i1.p1 TRINITY_DN49512_c0_g1~~TRINITY_DN49512_c0_g1_i1.p1  ORF type:complete len:753 (+),score=113.69 TRINITY_DN49512_c0_g1_i1:119-2377(+)
MLVRRHELRQRRRPTTPPQAAPGEEALQRWSLLSRGWAAWQQGAAASRWNRAVDVATHELSARLQLHGWSVAYRLAGRFQVRIRLLRVLQAWAFAAELSWRQEEGQLLHVLLLSLARRRLLAAMFRDWREAATGRSAGCMAFWSRRKLLRQQRGGVEEPPAGRVRASLRAWWQFCVSVRRGREVAKLLWSRRRAAIICCILAAWSAVCLDSRWCEQVRRVARSVAAERDGKQSQFLGRYARRSEMRRLRSSCFYSWGRISRVKVGGSKLLGWKLAGKIRWLLHSCIVAWLQCVSDAQQSQCMSRRSRTITTVVTERCDAAMAKMAHASQSRRMFLAWRNLTTRLDFQTALEVARGRAVSGKAAKHDQGSQTDELMEARSTAGCVVLLSAFDLREENAAGTSSASTRRALFGPERAAAELDHHEPPEDEPPERRSRPTSLDDLSWSSSGSEGETEPHWPGSLRLKPASLPTVQLCAKQDDRLLIAEDERPEPEPPPVLLAKVFAAWMAVCAAAQMLAAMDFGSPSVDAEDFQRRDAAELVLHHGQEDLALGHKAMIGQEGKAAQLKQLKDFRLEQLRALQIAAMDARGRRQARTLLLHTYFSWSVAYYRARSSIWFVTLPSRRLLGVNSVLRVWALQSLVILWRIWAAWTCSVLQAFEEKTYEQMKRWRAAARRLVLKQCQSRSKVSLHCVLTAWARLISVGEEVAALSGAGGGRGVTFVPSGRHCLVLPPPRLLGDDGFSPFWPAVPISWSA